MSDHAHTQTSKGLIPSKRSLRTPEMGAPTSGLSLQFFTIVDFGNIYLGSLYIISNYYMQPLVRYLSEPNFSRRPESSWLFTER
jgi:hypothetical protein